MHAIFIENRGEIMDMEEYASLEEVICYTTENSLVGLVFNSSILSCFSEQNSVSFNHFLPDFLLNSTIKKPEDARHKILSK